MYSLKFVIIHQSLKKTETMSSTIKEFLIQRSIEDADYIAHEMEAQKVRISCIKRLIFLYNIT